MTNRANLAMHRTYQYPATTSITGNVSPDFMCPPILIHQFLRVESLLSESNQVSYQFPAVTWRRRRP